MKARMFTPNRKLIILAIALYIINILIILQLIPVFESQSFGANAQLFGASLKESFLGILELDSISYLMFDIISFLKHAR